MTALMRKYRAVRLDKESFTGCLDCEGLRYRREQERRAGW